jgi:hypothetical protein
MASSDEPGARPETVELGSFEGEVDEAAGTFVIRSQGAIVVGGPAPSTHAIVALPEGSGSPGYVTVANVPGSVDLNAPNGCSAGNNATQATVRIASFYPSTPTPYFLRNVWAQVTRIDATGVSGCNSASSYPSGAGLANDKGLWAYTGIDPGSSADATWKFSRPGATAYRFGGVIKGEVVTQSVPTNVFVTVTNPTAIAYTSNDQNMWVVAASATPTLYRFLATATPLGTPTSYGLTSFTALLAPTAAVAGDNNAAIVVTGTNPATHDSIIQRVSTSTGSASRTTTYAGTDELVAVSNDSNSNAILAADRFGGRVRFYAASNLGESQGSPCTSAPPCNLGSTPVALVYTGTLNTAGPTWVANFGSNTVTVLTPTGAGGNISYTGTSYATGAGPVALAYDGSTYVWVANQTAFTVTRHAKATPGTVTTFAVDNRPDDIAIDASGNVWVLSKAARVLTKLNGAGTYQATYALSFLPTKIRAFGGYLWLGDASGSVLVRWTGT